MLSEVSTGASVGRRLHELQNALDTSIPLSSSSEEAKSVPPDHEASQDSSTGDENENLTASSTATLPQKLDWTDNDVPTTPTSSSSNVPSLLATSVLSSSTLASTPTSSPRPADLKLGPAFEQVLSDSESYSMASTPDEDRFSTVQLKTPQSPHGAFSHQPSDLSHSSSAQLLEHGIVMSPVHDDEVDLTETRTGSHNTHTQGDRELRIRTDLGHDREDSMLTPIAGSSGLSREASPGSAALSRSNTRKATTEGVDFLLARLDKVKEDPDIGRRSMEGHERLKEDFQKLQSSSPSKNAFPHKMPHDEPNGAGSDEKIDWDFWGDVIASYEQVARTQPEKLAAAIQRGIPSALRGMVWQLMSTSKDAELERIYAALLKESSPHEKPIVRDLGRTFPQHAFFMDGQGIGQENLFNVLKAYSLYDPEVGYCQGLAFIGAALLLNMPDEEAFCVLVRLMYSYNLRDMFLPEMPGLQLRLFQFDRLVEELLPLLHIHFVRQGVKSSMYCSQWFLTLFSYRFPLDLVFRIFDSVFGHGIEAIFGFSLMLLIKNEEKLLNLKFDHILEYMKGELFDIYRIESDETDLASKGADPRPVYRADEFVQDAFSVRITPFMLDNFANEWQEMRRVQNAHAVELDNLRTANRNMAAQMRDLEASLSALNAEHCELVKQLVMGKIEREEVESELVRYKLMYAEVMHDKEDAMSSHRMSASPGPRSSGLSAISLSFPSFGRSS